MTDGWFRIHRNDHQHVLFIYKRIFSAAIALEFVSLLCPNENFLRQLDML